MRRPVGLLLALAVLLSGATATVAQASPEVSLVGEVERLVVELTDGTDVDLTMVVPAEGQAVRVENEALAEVPSGAVVEVALRDGVVGQGAIDPDGGAPVADAVVVVEAEPAAPADAAVPADAAAPAETAVPADAAADRTETAPVADGVPVSDGVPGSMARTVHVLTATLPGQAAGSITTATLAGEVASSISPYWSDSTGGVVTFTTGSQVAAATFDGWGSTSTCTSGQILAFLSWTAAQAGVSPTVSTRRHTLTWTPAFAACGGFSGVANLADGGSAWINGATNAASRVGTSIHELGHTMRLHHSDTRFACSGGADGHASQCTTAEYGDAYDTMGVVAQGVDGPLSGAQLDVLGLLGPASTLDLTASTEVTLAPVGGLTGLRFVRLQTDDATYYLELRGAVGRDTDLATVRRGCPTGVSVCTYERVVPGVLVRRVDADATTTRTALLRAGAGGAWAMQAGGVFTTADGEWRVSVLSASTSAAQLRVERLVAPAPAGDAVYQPVTPTRAASGLVLGPGASSVLTIPDVPAQATAVSLNITSAGVRDISFLSACATGTPLDACRATSVANPMPYSDTAAAATVALGGVAGDQVTIYNNAGTLVLYVDVQGFFAAGAGVSGSLFVPVDPVRAMDRGFGAGEAHTLTLPDVPPGATAVAVNLTYSGASSTSFTSLCPAGGQLATCTATSAINPMRGRDAANLVTVRLGGPANDQLTVYNNAGTVRLIADVRGYYVDESVAPAGAGTYYPVSPVRVLNRLPMGAGGWHVQALPDVPVGATAALVNLTSAAVTGTSYVSACSADTPVSTCRATSVLNPMAGLDSPNNAVVQLGGTAGDQVLLYNNGATIGLIVDVLGYFVPRP